MPTITQDELARELTTKYVLDDQSADGLMPSARILAAKYGVSRLFLREVLAGMQRQGLIKAVPGKGVFIRKPHMLDTARNVHTTLRQSAATARDLIEARINLEEQTVYLAAIRATEDDIAQLELALTAFDNATELLPRAESDIAFHAISEFSAPTVDYSAAVQFSNRKATSMCDISDALVIQAEQIAAASAVQLRIEKDLICNHPEFGTLSELADSQGVDVWQWILAGGEDHVFLATGKELDGFRIGSVQSGSGVVGVEMKKAPDTWRHFT